MKRLSHSFFLFSTAFLLVFLLAALILQTYRYTRLETTFDLTASSLENSDSERHGIVESVDVAAQQLTVRVINRFQPTDTGRAVRVHVSERTHIARQSLIGERGTYTGMSDEVRAPLSAIAPGDRVLLLLARDGEDFLAIKILFGDPL